MADVVLALVGLAALVGFGSFMAGTGLRAGQTRALIRRIREISGNPAWFSGDSVMNWSRVMRYGAGACLPPAPIQSQNGALQSQDGLP